LQIGKICIKKRQPHQKNKWQCHNGKKNFRNTGSCFHALDGSVCAYGKYGDANSRQRCLRQHYGLGYFHKNAKLKPRGENQFNPQREPANIRYRAGKQMSGKGNKSRAGFCLCSGRYRGGNKPPHSCCKHNKPDNDNPAVLPRKFRYPARQDNNPGAKRTKDY